ncbi:MAG: hypothetical protein EOQ69_24345, partial [Mesorhizobium sp.]|uniref:hypothetical protein n=1 Tax=Mesorhizobium TaxID=68287 RepID=UPI000FE7B008
MECWERELQLTGHVNCPTSSEPMDRLGTFHAKPFESGRSWAGARPEARAIGYDAHGVAAHIVILHLRHTPAGPDPAL